MPIVIAPGVVIEEGIQIGGDVNPTPHQLIITQDGDTLITQDGDNLIT